MVAFMTQEESVPTAAPVVSMNGTEYKGVTHEHDPCSVGNTTCSGGPYKPRKLYFHFVRLSSLQPRAMYSYKVKSGSSIGIWSKTFNFRAPYSEGVTKIALYGDMGVYTWNKYATVSD